MHLLHLTTSKGGVGDNNNLGFFKRGERREGLKILVTLNYIPKQFFEFKLRIKKNNKVMLQYLII